MKINGTRTGREYTVRVVTLIESCFEFGRLRPVAVAEILMGDVWVELPGSDLDGECVSAADVNGLRRERRRVGQKLRRMIKRNGVWD